MIAKSYILANLTQLDSAYKKATPKYALYFSKLAILELCGWIEISIDGVIAGCARKGLSAQSSVSYIDAAIKKTYGFHYSKHLRELLVKSVGIAGVESIETTLNQVTLVQLQAQLNSLYVMRNSLAHTYVKGKASTINIDSPSVTLGRFQHIYNGLSEVEAALKAL